MKIEFTTPRGAVIELNADPINGIHAAVNSKPHTSFVASLVKADPEAGPHVALAGKVRAQIPAEDVARVTAWFAEVRQMQARNLVLAKEEARRDPMNAHDRLIEDMDRWNSDN